jgi:hypothetical protein
LVWKKSNHTVADPAAASTAGRDPVIATATTTAAKTSATLALSIVARNGTIAAATAGGAVMPAPNASHGRHLSRVTSPSIRLDRPVVTPLHTISTRSTPFFAVP